MRRIAVLVETARAKALRVGVVHHHILGDVPGKITAALEAGLAVGKIVLVEVVTRATLAPAGRQAGLEAAEARHDTAGHGVIEAKVPRAGRQRQYVRNQVEVERGEESGLLGLAHLVLVEGGVVALNPRVLHGRAGEGADVRQAAGIARRARRTV